MTIRIQPYKHWSGGAKALGRRCGILQATQKQVERHGDFTHIINWGSTEEKFNGTYLNTPAKVADACNKKTSFQILARDDVPIPHFTTRTNAASRWWDEGEAVVIRHLLRASAGRGVIVASRARNTPIVPAPLYTKYMKKATEYRVHCVSGAIIDIQQKRKRQEMNNEDVDYQIRNAHRGWVYCRGGVDAPAAVGAAGLSAVAALGLDFGAVDIGWNEHNQTACVYEVNTAPGLEGSTLDKYYWAFLELFPTLQGGAFRRRRSMD